MEVKPSIRLLTKINSRFLFNPSSMAPTMVIEPIQKRRKAVIKPSVKEESSTFTIDFNWSESPLKMESTEISSPVMPPI